MNEIAVRPHRRADAHAEPVRLRDLRAAAVIEIARAFDADLDQVEAHPRDHAAPAAPNSSVVTGEVQTHAFTPICAM